jgi:peptide-methionine (S)-S-oxide reductase
VTEIVPFIKFYVAEDYHKNYYEQNKNAGYCRFVIEPKVQKLVKQYKNELKGEYA